MATTQCWSLELGGQALAEVEVGAGFGAGAGCSQSRRRSISWNKKKVRSRSKNMNTVRSRNSGIGYEEALKMVWDFTEHLMGRKVNEKEVL